MSWILVLYFTCAAGCGAPGSVALPQTYATQQECTAAGKAWLSPNANPTQALASFSCGRKREYGVAGPGECAIGFSEETCRRRGLKYNPPRQN